MGIFVAIFILLSGINTAKETINHILGKPPEKSLIDDIKNEDILNVEKELGEIKIAVRKNPITETHVIKKDINEKEFIDELRTRNGNLKIILTHPIDDNEL